MAIIVPEQQDVQLGNSRITPAETYVRQTPQDVSSGFQALSKALGIYADNADNMKYKEDLANKEVYTQQLREALNGRKPTDEDVNNVLSGVHPLVRARLSEDLGYLDALSKGSEYFKDIPLTLAPEQATAAFDGILAKASADADGGNLSYKAGYLKAMNQLVASRANADNTARAKEVADVTTQAYGTRMYNSFSDSYKAFRQMTIGSASQQEAVKKVADSLGISPRDLAAAISYETGGTMSPSKRGGMNKDGTGAGSFLGLIQFSPENQQRYGVTPGQSFEEQMAAVGQYLKDRGVKPGMGLMDIYSAINAGTVGRYDAADVNGTVRSHTARIAKDHYAAADKFLGTTTISDAEPGISGKPLTPFQQFLRDQFVEIDTEYQRTSNVDKGILRDQAANSIMQLAVDNLDETILDAIPDRILTPDLREKFTKIREHIQSEAGQAESRAAAKQERILKQMTRSAEQEMIDLLSKGQETLTGEQIIKFKNINPDLIGKWKELRDGMEAAKLDPNGDMERLHQFYRAVDATAAKGYDVTEVPMDKVLGAENRKAAYAYVEKMRVEGGERNDKFYKDAWEMSRKNNYDYLYGGAVPVKAQPAMDEVEFTFKHELNFRISQFVEKNGRLPKNEDERYVIFKEARDETLSQWPLKRVLEGQDVGPGEIPTTPSEAAKAKEQPKAQEPKSTELPFKVQPDGSVTSPYGNWKQTIGPDGKIKWVKEQ